MSASLANNRLRFRELAHQTRAVESAGHQTLLELSLSGRGIGNPMSIFTPRVADPLVRIVETLQSCAATLSAPQCRSIRALVIESLISLGKDLLEFARQESELLESGLPDTRSPSHAACQAKAGSAGLNICRRWTTELTELHRQVSSHHSALFGDLMTNATALERERRRLDATLEKQPNRTSEPSDCASHEIDLDLLLENARSEAERDLIAGLMAHLKLSNELEQQASVALPAISQLEQCRDKLDATFIVLGNIGNLCAQRAQERDPWFKQALEVHARALTPTPAPKSQCTSPASP